jgi:hypothetical protein
MTSTGDCGSDAKSWSKNLSLDWAHVAIFRLKLFFLKIYFLSKIGINHLPTNLLHQNKMQ